MKTVEQILEKHNIVGLGTEKEQIQAAFDEYKNQQADPIPIDDLFKIHKDNDHKEIWIKLKNTHICHAIYDPYRKRLHLSGGMTLSEGEIKYGCESFIIIERPKF